MNGEQPFSQRVVDILSTLTIIAISFGIGYGLGQSRWAPLNLTGAASETPVDARAQFTPFWEVYDLINTEYFDQPVDQEQLVTGAIDGMLATLGDRNTTYMSPEEQESAVQSMQGEFQGIGAEVESIDGFVTVVSPISGSPAEAAGIRPRDVILTADGTDLIGMDVGDAAAIIRGPAGTDVLLEIRREEEVFELVITRARIDLPSVSGEILPSEETNGEEIAYIRINRFAENTDDELEEILEEQVTSDLDGMIIDLRRNPGGSLDTVVNIADQFLPDSNVLIERFGNGDERLFDATDRGLAEEIELVLLIDEGSASASEVLAGAVRDADRGVLIGVTSFGKGTVQNWSTLSNGGGVRITVARWLTPNGDWVHEVGLDPDIVIELPEDFDSTSEEDPQLEAAIDYLLNN